MAALSFTIILLFFVFYRELQLLFYDKAQATWLGVPTESIKSILLFLTGLWPCSSRHFSSAVRDAPADTNLGHALPASGPFNPTLAFGSETEAQPLDTEEHYVCMIEPLMRSSSPNT